MTPTPSRRESDTDRQTVRDAARAYASYLRSYAIEHKTLTGIDAAERIERSLVSLASNPPEGEDTCECDCCLRVFPLSAITFKAGGKSCCPECAPSNPGDPTEGEEGLREALMALKVAKGWLAPGEHYASRLRYLRTVIDNCERALAPGWTAAKSLQPQPQEDLSAPAPSFDRADESMERG